MKIENDLILRKTIDFLWNELYDVVYFSPGDIDHKLIDKNLHNFFIPSIGNEWFIDFIIQFNSKYKDNLSMSSCCNCEGETLYLSISDDELIELGNKLNFKEKIHERT